MAWFTRRSPSPKPGVADVRVSLDGWISDQRETRTAGWHDAAGNALTLNVVDETELALAPEPRALQAFFRRMAEEGNGGLVEAAMEPWRHGQAAHGIYKKQLGMGFMFTGLLTMQMPVASLVWAVCTGERGTTGVREAAVAAMLLERGEITLEWFQRNWAQDPYDPDYRARGRVDSATLRYHSDDERFDAMFPAHPLTRLRAEIRRLRADVDVDQAAFGCGPAS